MVQIGIALVALALGVAVGAVLVVLRKPGTAAARCRRHTAGGG